MTTTILLQVLFNIALMAVVFILYKKLTRKPSEDPRLSRGLQLLQAKIAILEDLSDRTDSQVEKMIQLLDMKAAEVQKKLKASDDQIKQLELSMNKSREVAGLFEDKIPHHEVIERESSVKYIKAAQMANKGASVSDISETLGLSTGEAEFIVKVNKDELMFDEEQLPEWAKISLNKLERKKSNYVEDQFSKYDITLDEPKRDYDEMKKLGEEFRKACSEFELKSDLTPKSIQKPNQVVETKNTVFIPEKTLGVQPVEFPQENLENSEIESQKP